MTRIRLYSLAYRVCKALGLRRWESRLWRKTLMLVWEDKIAPFEPYWKQR